MNSTTFTTMLKLRSTRKLRRARNKILILGLMSSSIFMQAMESDFNFKLKAAVAVVGIAVAGVAAWRMTAPSDRDVVNDIDYSILDKKLAKYNQTFDVDSQHGDQEQKLVDNLIDKLDYSDQYQEQDIIQAHLHNDAQELKNLKESIWFRSFFNTEVSHKYNEIDASRLQARNLRCYFKHHDNYFKGCNILKAHKNLIEQAYKESDFVRGIRKAYIGHLYPLMHFEDQYVKDVQWMRSCKKGDYPILENELKVLCANAEDSILELRGHAEYAREQEKKERQDIHSVQGMHAQAELLSAQTAAHQAKTAAHNVTIEQQRIECEKAHNERERVQARVKELGRYGYSDLAIQQQLNRDRIINMIFGFFLAQNN